MTTKRIIDTDLMNRVAMWGLILGVVMSCSRIFEIKMLITGGLKNYTMMTAEWFVAIFVYAYILFRANQQRSREIPADQEFRFGQSLNYSIVIAVFAGVIVGITSHIYLTNVVGGYDVYAEKSFQAIVNIIEEADVEYSDVEGLVEQNMSSVKAIGENPPSMLSWIMSSVASYILSSFVIGLGIASFTKRKGEVSNNE